MSIQHHQNLKKTMKSDMQLNFQNSKNVYWRANAVRKLLNHNDWFSFFHNFISDCGKAIDQQSTQKLL